MALIGTAGGFGHVEAGFGGEAGAFELNSGVRDFKIARKNLLNVAQDFFGFFHVHIGNAGVTGERVEIRAERPDMNVVNFLHAFDL